jgi:hypothetical protein
LVGAELLRDEAFYVIVDSDLNNNEVAGQIELHAGDGKALLFPGKSYALGSLTGGCQYHIISERIALEWKPIPDEVLNPEEGEIFAFVFSTGGGTGGGAGLQLAAKSRERSEPKNRLIHRMGIAVLPTSDEPYFVVEQPRSLDGAAELPPPLMDVAEKYNTGRFFVSMLGGRTSGVGSKKALDGTWLVSNDLLRTVVHEASASSSVDMGVAKTADKLGLSLINSYIGLALCTLCNASSRGTISGANLDPRELNNHLNSPYISAFGYAKRDKGASGESLVLHLQQLLQRTFCGTRIADGQLQGVSVALRETEVTALQSVLLAPAATLTEFRKGLSGQPLPGEPSEFRTARRVVVLLGQPQGATDNLGVEAAARSAVARVFATPDVVWYPFLHAGDLEYLLVFAVDPFVPVIVNSMFDYIARTWLRDTSQGSVLPGYVLGGEERTSLEDQLVREDELMHLPESPIGSAAANSISTTVSIPFGPGVVVAALDRLRDILRWKAVKPPRMISLQRQ